MTKTDSSTTTLADALPQEMARVREILGLTASRDPKHPLMLSYHTVLVPMKGAPHV